MTQRKRKIRVALVNLPQCVPELMYTPRVRKAYTETAQILPNLSLAYLAAGLEREGFEVLFIEAFALGLSVDEIGRKLREFQPVAVGYNLITETFLESLACIRAVRERCPIPNVVGGMHLSLYPGETLSHQCIDYGIIGEGWEAMPELLHALADGGAGLDAVRGLIFRRDGMVVRNPARDAVTQLETFPFPARRLLPINAYNCVMSKRHPITVMISSYGCPFHCAYCDVGNLGYQMRSAASVVAEMRECRSKYGIREIWFQDETFTLKEERILAICEAIRSEGLDITWSIRTRVELVSRAMLREMRSAGCFKIHFGVESADPTVLEHLNRNIPLEKIRCAFAWAKEEKISTLAFFMIGNPGEDRASI